MSPTDDLVGMVADHLRLMADRVDRLKDAWNPGYRAAQVHHIVFSSDALPTSLEELVRRLWIAARQEEASSTSPNS